MSSTVRRSAWGASKSKFLLSAAATVLLAACSADADRFAENPSDADPVYTASVPKRSAAPVAASASGDEVVSSKPLTGASVQPPAYDYSKSYKAPQYKQPAITKAPAISTPDVSVPQPEVAEAPSVPAGSTVTVGPGMTLYSIARANNMSVSQLAAANGIKAPYSVHTGQSIRVPGTSEAMAPQASAPIRQAEAPAKPFKSGPSVADNAPAGTHTVGNGETLFSLGRKYGVSPYTIADANGLPHNAQLSAGQKVRIPGGSSADAPVAAVKKPAAPSSAPKLETAQKAEPLTAPSDSAAPAAQPEKTAEAQPASPATDAQSDTGTGPTVAEGAPIDGASGMRWPVRGKVISGFGPKSNGLKNEGINIAVPEGTSVRAADSGVVAYAGNELKGYGNLVLIRHENGYVTAYAHAKELFVKRGDTVKRGDVIAKAGQTGSVSSPQLHFEVRKGATALDPMKFLSSSTASN
jgi:murein DD-endopeptidase MepM/ murein hydrolase activator NlpD